MDEIQLALKKRYDHLGSLIFYRSLDKSLTNGDLFDILEDMPNKFPVVWNNKKRRWVHTNDLLQGDFSKNINTAEKDNT
jgi:hypothetical protein